MSTSPNALHRVTCWSAQDPRPLVRSARPSATTASVTASSGRRIVALAEPGGLAGALDQPLERLASDALDVVARLEQRAERALRRLRLDALLPQRVERLHPVERLAHARNAVEVEPAELLHERARLADESVGRLGQAGVDDRHLAREVRVLDPVVQAAALERLVQLARPVRGDH